MKMFKCSKPDCSTAFSSKKGLNGHMSTHEKERKFECSICKHRFAQPTSLQKHQRVHDNLKPFSCEEPGCSLIFSMKSNLRRHVRNLHTGAEPSFECDICQDSFKTKNNLHQHSVKHMEKVDRE